MRAANLAALAAALSVVGAVPQGTPHFGMRGSYGSRRRRRRAGEGVTQEQVEKDLLRAEVALAAAGTPGARRKAQRKVDALRALLGKEAV